MTRRTAFAAASLLLALVLTPAVSAQPNDDLADAFRHPPAAARPRVYWFWMDGNSSREGITADLEAMKAAGIGGVIMMEVDVGIPKGPVAFMGPKWRELLKHSASEAARLGLEIDLNVSPGWTGSGGPWVKPEQSMQKVVFSEATVSGPKPFDATLAQPPAQEGFYRDVAVLAFPTPKGTLRIGDVAHKALYKRGHYSSESGVPTHLPTPGSQPAAPGEVIASQAIQDLTARMDATGRLKWDAPDGDWTIIRFGRTSTGANTRPAPAPGLGLECDKLDPAALDAHWEAYMGTIMRDLGELTGKSLTSVHIDSWEMGPQNWTARMREEFQRLRGYDPLPYLPVMTGRIVGSPEISERFLWDLRQTVSDLIVSNHARHLRELAHRSGLRLSIEPYDGTPCDDLTYGAVADVPMCEFWANCFDTWFSLNEARSIAHTYGQRIVAAEAFTANDKERWQLYPGAIKALGDKAFCRGVNRIVFHRYAHQPWLDRSPGMTMGPYGIHFERTQTWWDMVPAYTQYLARCQALLQRGLPVADVCYLAPEGAPNTSPFGDVQPGYAFDICTPEALLTRMSVRGGRFVLPDGMSYALLVLPQTGTMTPQLLRKVKELVEAGGTILGSPPEKSPSLQDYPKCDEEVARLARELWGNSLAFERAEHRCGAGRVIGMKPLAKPEAEPVGNPLEGAKWIWQNEGNPAAAAPVGQRYFSRRFRVDPARPIESARVYMTADNSFECFLNGRKAATGNNFNTVVCADVTAFTKPGTNVVSVIADNGGNGPNPAGLIGRLEIRYKDGRATRIVTDAKWGTSATSPAISTGSAAADAPARELGDFGMAPWGRPELRPTTAYVYYPDPQLIAGVLTRTGDHPDFESDADLPYIHRRDGDTDAFFVSNPASKAVIGQCTFRVSGETPEVWDPVTGVARPALIDREKSGRTWLRLQLPPSGSAFVIFRKGSAAAPTAAVADGTSAGASEQTNTAGENVSSAPKPFDITGPWEVTFQPKRGAPEKATFDALMDWSKHPDAGVRYFSGIATYHKTFELPADIGEASPADHRLYLDLGKVHVMADVKLNGRDLGVLWTEPYRVDITDAVRPGRNTLEIRVANLWPNRLIGDAGLPADKRIAWTTWNPFTKETPLLPSGLLGPATIQTTPTSPSR
jgi:hypothetical protein